MQKAAGSESGISLILSQPTLQHLRSVRLLLHLPSVSPGPTRCTQSTDAAAARAKTSIANVESTAASVAPNLQEAWRGDAAASQTRSPAIAGADEPHR